jgi:Uma2 family endonuclease
MAVLLDDDIELHDGATAAPPRPDRYEVIDGEIVAIPDMGVYSAETANLIRDELTIYARATKSGRPRQEMLFPIPSPSDPNRQRRPDVAFVSNERWPDHLAIPLEGNPAPVVPDLAVEVISPSDNAEDLLDKLHEYLRAGVRLVWLVWPRDRSVHAYSGPKSVRIFTIEDTLDAGELLPGFAVPMASLFPERPAAAPAVA